MAKRNKGSSSKGVARKGGGSSAGKGPDRAARSPSSTSQPTKQPRPANEADNVRGGESEPQSERGSSSDMDRADRRR
jgi:hypothetical protein